jgi:hypothetical protein
MTEEGIAHSDYLFQRDKKLKDEYDKSTKHYRIVPEMTKNKKKMGDMQKEAPEKDPEAKKEKHEVIRPVHEGISAKQTSINSNIGGRNVYIEDLSDKGGDFEVHIDGKRVFPPPQNNKLLLFVFVVVVIALIVYVSKIFFKNMEYDINSVDMEYDNSVDMADDISVGY